MAIKWLVTRMISLTVSHFANMPLSSLILDHWRETLQPPDAMLRVNTERRAITSMSMNAAEVLTASSLSPATWCHSLPSTPKKRASLVPAKPDTLSSRNECIHAACVGLTGIMIMFQHGREKYGTTREYNAFDGVSVVAALHGRQRCSEYRYAIC
jgi:hypothetical protein